jgi:signal transduction histidine kinase
LGTLERGGNRRRLEVTDCGCNFGASAVPGSEVSGLRVGLVEMPEKVTLLSGDFNVSSRSGEATHAVAKIPLLRPEDKR